MPFGWWLQVSLLICRLTVVQFLHLFCREELNQAAGDDSNSQSNPGFFGFSVSRFKRLCLWMVWRFPRSWIVVCRFLVLLRFKKTKKNKTNLLKFSVSSPTSRFRPGSLKRSGESPLFRNPPSVPVVCFLLKSCLCLLPSFFLCASPFSQPLSLPLRSALFFSPRISRPIVPLCLWLTVL